MKRAIAFFCGLWLMSWGVLAQNSVKILEWSWNNPDIDYLEENISRMNDECPHLDGLVIRVVGKEIIGDNGEKWTPQFSNAWSARRWEYDSFNDFITRYKKLHMGHFTDNFFYMTTSIVEFSWLDDSECATMIHNFGVAARVARECGFKGIALDIEEYGRHFWRHQDVKTDKTDAELDEIVFKRGQEWGREVFGAFPDIVIFMPFCLSMPNAPLAIDFMNGVIDVMPPTALIYEGMESSGYAARLCSAYITMQDGLRRLIRQDIRAENRRKARAQILLSPAFYLDAYFVNPKGNYYHDNLEPEHSELGAVRLLSRCFAAASLEAEPYIWLYGEKRCWWKGSTHPKNLGTWDEAPDGAGVTQALLEAKNPSGIQFATSKNLVPDHDFQKTGIWQLWQIEMDQKKPVPGHGVLGNGKASLFKTTRACYCQNLPCKPGQLYLFAAHGCVVNKNSGIGKVALAFKDDAGKWLPFAGNLTLTIPATGKIETVWSYVIAPTNATQVSVQCGAANQSEGGEIFFTGIYLEEK